MVAVERSAEDSQQGLSAKAGGPKRDHFLTREEILGTALELVDDEGLAALTMRRLAAILGVEAMSLYHHFPNKDALLDGVLANVLADMKLPDRIPENWVFRAEATVLALRRALARHPHVVPVLVERPLNASALAPYLRPSAEAILAADFTEDQAGEILRSLIALSFGHALLTENVARAAEEAAQAGAVAGDQSISFVFDEEGWSNSFDEAGFRRATRILMRGYSENQEQR